MRNNGGFILIKINKEPTDITADDFNKDEIKKIWDIKSLKPIILETARKTIILSPHYNNTQLFYESFISKLYYDDDSQEYAYEGFENTFLIYSKTSDALIFEFSYRVE